MNTEDGVSLFSMAHPQRTSLFKRIVLFFRHRDLSPKSLSVMEIDLDATP